MTNVSGSKLYTDNFYPISQFHCVPYYYLIVYLTELCTSVENQFIYAKPVQSLCVSDVLLSSITSSVSRITVLKTPLHPILIKYAMGVAHNLLQL